MKRTLSDKLKDALFAFRNGRGIERNPGKYTVRLFDEDDSNHSLPDTLGMSEERAEEIGKFVMKSFGQNHRFTDCIAEISAIATHQNELFFATWVLHQMYDKHHSNPMALFAKLFGKS